MQRFSSHRKNHSVCSHDSSIENGRGEIWLGEMHWRSTSWVRTWWLRALFWWGRPLLMGGNLTPTSSNLKWEADNFAESVWGHGIWWGWILPTWRHATKRFPRKKDCVRSFGVPFWKHLRIHKERWQSIESDQTCFMGHWPLAVMGNWPLAWIGEGHSWAGRCETCFESVTTMELLSLSEQCHCFSVAWKSDDFFGWIAFHSVRWSHVPWLVSQMTPFQESLWFGWLWKEKHQNDGTMCSHFDLILLHVCHQVHKSHPAQMHPSRARSTHLWSDCNVSLERFVHCVQRCFMQLKCELDLCDNKLDLKLFSHMMIASKGPIHWFLEISSIIVAMSNFLWVLSQCQPSFFAVTTFVSCHWCLSDLICSLCKFLQSLLDWTGTCCTGSCSLLISGELFQRICCHVPDSKLENQNGDCVIFSITVLPFQSFFLSLLLSLFVVDHFMQQHTPHPKPLKGHWRLSDRMKKISGAHWGERLQGSKAGRACQVWVAPCDNFVQPSWDGADNECDFPQALKVSWSGLQPLWRAQMSSHQWCTESGTCVQWWQCAHPLWCMTVQKEQAPIDGNIGRQFWCREAGRKEWDAWWSSWRGSQFDTTWVKLEARDCQFYKGTLTVTEIRVFDEDGCQQHQDRQQRDFWGKGIVQGNSFEGILWQAAESDPASFMGDWPLAQIGEGSPWAGRSETWVESVPTMENFHWCHCSSIAWKPGDTFWKECISRWSFVLWLVSQMTPCQESLWLWKERTKKTGNLCFHFDLILAHVCHQAHKSLLDSELTIVALAHVMISSEMFQIICCCWSCTRPKVRKSQWRWCVVVWTTVCTSCSTQTQKMRDVIFCLLEYRTTTTTTTRQTSIRSIIIKTHQSPTYRQCHYKLKKALCVHKKNKKIFAAFAASQQTNNNVDFEIFNHLSRNVYCRRPTWLFLVHTAFFGRQQVCKERRIVGEYKL